MNEIKLSKNDIKRGLSLPNEYSEQLAEYIGILAGDGYINFDAKKYSYIIEIAGNKILDKDYLENYIKSLVKKLFNLDCKVYYKKNGNTTNIRILSKGLFFYLVDLGFKNGKKEQIGVPDWILKDDKLMLAFIKGLIDTDGSLMLIKKKSKISDFYPVISLKLKSKVLINQVGNFLKSQGFSANIIEDEVKFDKRINKSTIISSLIVSGRKNLHFWMKTISFRNKKHIDKYEKYIKSLKKYMGREEFESSTFRIKNLHF